LYPTPLEKEARKGLVNTLHINDLRKMMRQKSMMKLAIKKASIQRLFGTVLYARNHACASLFVRENEFSAHSNRIFQLTIEHGNGPIFAPIA
jgi:hypothetical protein